MKKIWKKEFSLKSLNSFRRSSMVNHIGINFSNFGPDFLEAEMPVDERTIQPYGILHGGASVALAETLGSVASNLCLSPEDELLPVGIEINASHMRSVTSGKVTGRAKAIRLGRSIHVWNIEIRDEEENLTCISRLTTKIIRKSK